MVTPRSDETAEPRRRRGRPPRIDRARIVAAARAIAPEDLTMQAVADALGVDRTSLHYYVGDRDGLLELLVTDLFETELRRTELPEDGSWPEVLHAYATAIHRGVLNVHTTGAHFRLRGTGSLALAERVLKSLTEAGFGVDDAGRILTLVSGIAMSAAHDLLGGEQSKLRQHPEVARALNEVAQGEFPLLGDVVANRAAADAAADDFEFSLDVVIAGLQQKLAGA
ncbi:TetR/AcrR family transcriptional regulator [Mycolicibacterium sp.]|uniref:TetR/AcrR family transcriptional regulator n=1 Tax=Mycolicibacterium sp. TaxID=2320850 RepID=UPI0035604758